MKTIRDWLSELPEPYKGQALANMDTQRLSNEGGTHANMRSAIEAAFRWLDSTEGTMYWSDLRDKYKSALSLDECAAPPTNAISALHAIALKEGVLVEEIMSVLPGLETGGWIYSLVNGHPEDHFINFSTSK